MPKRRDWTILIGVDDDQPTKNAIRHVRRVFHGLPTEERPRILLLHVIEQSIAPGAEFGEPTFAWEVGGVSGITPPIPEAEIERREQAAFDEMEPFVNALVESGWPASSVDRRAVAGGFSKAVIADVIAYTAREEDARVVVVGRTRHGRLHEALLKSMGERLTHYLPGTTVWVVGTPDEDGDEDDE